jgi:protein-L-isoaspartate O-methyltransferase
MRKVPRHRFVPSFLAPLAYQDTPLPIGFDKTQIASMPQMLGARFRGWAKEADRK